MHLVVLSMGGNLETAFVLPAIYSSQFAPPSDSESNHIIQYQDGGWFEYDPVNGRWLIKGIKSLTIEAADNITFKTSALIVEASMRINGSAVINGDVTQGGGTINSNGVVVDKHTHKGVKSGGDISGGPV